jgi:hypothetical protein
VAEGLNLTKESFNLVLAGGNLTHEGSKLAEKLVQRLNSEFPHANIKKPEVDPESAVALLAINKFNL